MPNTPTESIALQSAPLVPPINKKIRTWISLDYYTVKRLKVLAQLNKHNVNEEIVEIVENYMNNWAGAMPAENLKKGAIR